jgi:hypothetical protein
LASECTPAPEGVDNKDDHLFAAYPEGLMSSSDHTSLDSELTRAIDDLESALDHAADAAAELRRLVPKVAAIDAMLDELDSALHAGRQRLVDGSADPSSTGRAHQQPANGVPSRPLPRPFAAPVEPAASTDPWSQVATTLQADAPLSALGPASDGEVAPPVHPDAAGLVCFRLEFESRPGPLDLRTVDDAVSEHPAVQDVALLDYDGKHASLKVWIDSTATPATVQEMLLARASEIFGSDNDVTVVALEDAA